MGYITILIMHIITPCLPALFGNDTFCKFCCSVAKLCPLFATPWTAASQGSLSFCQVRHLDIWVWSSRERSFAISWSFLKLMSIELVMSSNHLILCCPLLLLPSTFPSIRVFSSDQVFASGGQSIGASASVPVLPMNIQDWFPLELTGLISLLS